MSTPTISKKVCQISYEPEFNKIKISESRYQASILFKNCPNSTKVQLGLKTFFPKAAKGTHNAMPLRF
jgi:hypothetical protein